MSLVNTFYPQHLLPTGEQCPVCIDPINLVVCLPPAAGRHLLSLVGDLVERLRPHVGAAAGLLDGRHFMLWRRPIPPRPGCWCCRRRTRNALARSGAPAARSACWTWPPRRSCCASVPHPIWRTGTPPWPTPNRPGRGGTTWTRTTPTRTATRRHGRSPTSRPSHASRRWSPPPPWPPVIGSRRTCTDPAWKPYIPATPTSTPTTRPGC